MLLKDARSSLEDAKVLHLVERQLSLMPSRSSMASGQRMRSMLQLMESSAAGEKLTFFHRHGTKISIMKLEVELWLTRRRSLVTQNVLSFVI